MKNLPLPIHRQGFIMDSTKTFQIGFTVYVEASNDAEARELMDDFTKNITNTAGWDVIKVDPPVEITNEDLDEALDYND